MKELSSTKMIIISIVFSTLFNYMFLYSPWGLSVLVFNIGLLIVFYLLLKERKRFNLRLFIISASIIFILSIPFLRFDYWLFKSVNLILLPITYGLLLMNNIENNIDKQLKIALITVFSPVTKLKEFYKDLPISKFKSSPTIGKIVIGLFISIAFLSIILPLLLSSDAIFNNMFEELFSNIQFEDINLNHLIMRTTVFLFMCGYLYAQFLAPSRNTPIDDIVINEIKTFDKVISIVILVTINFVYLLYSFIQIRYLFIKDYIQIEGISYSDYAREGFFQLLTVTIINLVLIIVFNKRKVKSIALNILLLITVGCTYIMTFSAFYRMYLYESAYGFTQLRLLVYLFLIGEIIILVPMIIGILNQKFRFVEYAFVLGITYYLLATFINIDGFIAYQNIQRYESTNMLDYYYLAHLSSDALPMIQDFVDTHYSEIPDNYQDDFKWYFVTGKKDPWYAFNISRSRLTLYEKGYNEKKVDTYDY